MRKIEATACARSRLSLRLSTASPRLSAWPTTSTAIWASPATSLASRLSGPRVTGISMCGRSALNEGSTGATTTSTSPRRSTSNLLPATAAFRRASCSSSQAGVTLAASALLAVLASAALSLPPDDHQLESFSVDEAFDLSTWATGSSLSLFSAV
ncbi:hypothetical protein D3C84_957040 [compost metagenome]